MKDLKHLNLPLLLSQILVFIIGLVTLFSTSPERANVQILFFLFGLAVYLALSVLDYQLLRFFWKPIYTVQMTLLVFTYLIGEIKLGASRWIDIGILTFQPSELAKFTMIVFISSVILVQGKDFQKLKNLLKIFLVSLPLIFLVLIQPDLGTSIVLLAILFGTLVFAGLRKLYTFLIIVLFGVLSNPIWHLLKDYQKQRILVFLNPQLDVLGSGYNVIQSLIAIGAGGLLGQGYSRGTQTHLNFLPAHWTDFIFASFAEEWGFVGVLVFLLLYLSLLLSLLYICLNCKNSFGALLTFGVFIVFFVQFIINVGMNLGIMPVTGIPLPLVSYGGTSLIVSMILLGIAQSVWVCSKR